MPHSCLSNSKMTSYGNKRLKLRSPAGDTRFCDITAGVLQGFFSEVFRIAYIDYILGKSLDLNHDLGCTLIKKKSSRHRAINTTYVDYADDLAILTDTLKDATMLLHKIKEVSK